MSGCFSKGDNLKENVLEAAELATVSSEIQSGSGDKLSFRAKGSLECVPGELVFWLFQQ